jgi:hypothetical protein
MGRPAKSENSKKPLKSFKRQSEDVRIEAAELREEVLEKRKRILGEEHPDTLTSMNDLARKDV